MDLKKDEFGRLMILPQKTETVLGLFMDQAADHRLLTKDEEVELFVELDRVWPDRLADVKRKKTPPPEARPIIEQLMSYNYRLVIRLANKLHTQEVPLPDLVQEGNLGLWRGIVGFDVSVGVRLSTYVTWWIRQTISRAILEQRTTIRKPVHVWDNHKRYTQAKDALQRPGSRPDDGEIAREMGEDWDGDQVKELRLLFKQSESDSLDELLYNDSDATGYHLISLEDQPVSASADYHGLREVLTEVLHTLDSRQQTIIEMRYGLNGRQPMTLEEVGQKYGLTRERIRQIEAAGMRKLRHPRRARRLRDFL